MILGNSVSAYAFQFEASSTDTYGRTASTSNSGATVASTKVKLKVNTDITAHINWISIGYV